MRPSHGKFQLAVCWEKIPSQTLKQSSGKVKPIEKIASFNPSRKRDYTKDASKNPKGKEKRMKRAIKAVLLTLMIFVIIMLSLASFYSSSLPKKLYYESSGDLDLSPFLSLSDSGCAAASTSSNRTATVKLCNIFPIGETELIKTERPCVVASGTPVGIKLLSKGVLVIKLGEVDGVSPAKEAGICVGDVILSVDGKEITSNEDIESAVKNAASDEISVQLIHEDKEKAVILKPALSKQDGCNKAGLWVRDSSAGIGTLTFYCPESKGFAGLGHPICDADTNELFDISSGSICQTKITGYKKATDSTPGALEGQFISGKTNGEILSNCDCGIYGSLSSDISQSETIPIAFKQEVEKGDAQILTTIDGTTPKYYSCKIEQITTDGTKNLVIRITDPSLLKKTGGILQGMSGSPIIQNGRLVGAVTHVMLESSDMGYGIFAETMYNELEQIMSAQSNTLKLAS
ncbi:MAG: SpoIVB peptidase [Ruminococcus sp.]|nr:SpoIVB peptidase [Ruminococcus sp.]